MLARINFTDWEERTFLSLKFSDVLLSNVDLQIRYFFSFLNPFPAHSFNLIIDIIIRMQFDEYFQIFPSCTTHIV